MSYCRFQYQSVARYGLIENVRGGGYKVARTFKLNAEDSGTAAAPVVYRAADGEVPEPPFGRCSASTNGVFRETPWLAPRSSRCVS